MHGDGGDVLMARRMRAQSNFTEYTPFALLLVLLLDLAGQDGWLLGLSAFAFLSGRVLHALGMDADQAGWPRMTGMILTFTVLTVLAIWAAMVAFRVI